MIRSHLLPLLFCLLTAAVTKAEDTCVAFWNVENLFDIQDDPNVEFDEDFTPTGAKQWTQEKLDRKLSNLSRLISQMNDKRGPDILGLAEIENRAVVQMLLAKLKPLGRKYEIVHHDSPSGRGIDCAIVYDAAKFELSAEKFWEVKETEQPTREVVEADLIATSGEALYVFANHWPARSHPESDREQAAKVLRKRLDAILAENPQADVIVVGDFNDFPDEPAMKTALRTVENKGEAVEGAFLNTMWPLMRAGKGTYVYGEKWDVLDHIIVSPGLLDEQGFRWKEGSTQAVLAVDDQLFDPSGPAIPRPNRSYSWNKFHYAGYSDHLPVQAILTK